MLVSKAARRYATALLELSKEKMVVDITLKDVQFIEKTISDSKDLQLFLASPVIKPSMKKNALNEIFKSHLSDVSTQFVQLVASKERSSILHQISISFIHQYNTYAGIMEVEVRAAKDLTKGQVNKLQKMLEKITSKKVNVSSNKQQNLIGGMLVKIEDTVIDGTIKHKLEQLEEKLLDSTIELN